MRTRIQKWGNSLAIRIPKPFAKEAGVQDGSEVELEVSRGRLVVSPQAGGRYRLRDLLAAVTRANLHGEEEFGPGLGREIW